MLSRRLSLSLPACATALCVSLATQAQASTLLVTGTSVVYPSNPAVTASLHLSNPATNYSSVYVSPQYLTGTLDGNAVNLFAYCVDILDPSGPGTFNVVSLLDYLNGNTTKYNQIAAVIAAAGGPVNKYSDAAAQAAIWELMYETSPFGASTGSFRIDNVRNDPTLIADTNSLLLQAQDNAGGTGSNLQLYVAKNSTKQDMLFWNRSAVPESSSWAMMLLGFGGIGLQMRRQRSISLRRLPQVA